MTDFNPDNVFILDPSLIDGSGHHLSAAREAMRQCKELNLASRVICHANANQEVLSLPAAPMFQCSGYALPSIERHGDEYAATMLLNNILLSDLLQINTTNLTPKDFILFPVVTYSQVVAICQWIASFAPEKSPKFGLGFLFQLNWNTDGVSGRSKEPVFRKAFQFIETAQRTNIVCTYETEAIAADYEGIVGMRGVICPIPTLNLDDSRQQVAPLKAARTSVSSDQVTIGFVGAAKPEKGIELLPEIVAKLLREVTNARIVVHMSPTGPAALDELYQIAKGQPRLAVSSAALGHEDYVELLNSLDINVLAYDPDNYGKRGSAVFNESISLGIPVVVPESTWMGDIVKKEQTGTYFTKYTPKAISSAILEAVHQIDAIRLAAQKLARSRQSTPYLASLISAL